MSNADESESKSNKSNDQLIAHLIKQRSGLHGRIKIFNKYLSQLVYPLEDDLKKTELRIRSQAAQSVYEEFNSIQSRIEYLVPVIELESHFEYREAFEMLYFQCMASSQTYLEGDKVTGSSGDEQPRSTASFSNIKLPQIKLPQFDGSYDQWLEFKNSYVTLIHKRTDLDLIQKFHYLRSSLTGSASQVISALEFTASNYILAWELLDDRFHNERLLVHNHVKSLFSMPSINKESPKQIRFMIDTVLRNLRALKTLNEPTESWDTLIIYLLASKFDVSTERKWETHKGTLKQEDSNYKLKLDDLITFLRNRADMLEMLNANHSKVPSTSKSDNKNVNVSKRHIPQQSQVHSYVTTRKPSTNSYTNNKSFDRRGSSCMMCKDNHPLYTCSLFLNLTVEERSNFVDDKKICRNCLRSGHPLNECLFGPCKQCQSKHNSLLHIERSTNTGSGQPTANKHTVAHGQSADRASAAATTGQAQNTTTLHSRSSTNNSEVRMSQLVLLSTALVEYNFHTFRALLDNGSQHCFVTEHLCKSLCVPSIQSTVQISGVGQSVSQSSFLCEINMRSKTSDYNTNLQCLVLPCITPRLPSHRIDVEMTCIPDNIQLADPSFNVPSEIDLLIGADKFWDLLYENKMRLPNGPHLQNTKLGWLISGPIYTINASLDNHVQCNFTQNLDGALRKFWEVEDIPNINNVLTEDEKQCEDLFVSTTKRENDGRFSVRIPLKESPASLGDSYQSAEKRFMSLERKLDRLPSYKQLYCDFLCEYAEMNHMTEINNYDSSHYFLPHHGVFRESSSTTKLRVVFDASAATSNGKSLNDIQRIGPKLQNDIFSILLRFRQHKYVGCADVEKMFRQVLVQSDMRDLQLILWRERSTDPLKIFQLNTVTYGTASAPYLSMRCLRQLAQECGDDVISDVINNDFFVDDLITGHDDSDILFDICKRTSNVLKSGCFPLRKWTFNYDVTTAMSKELTVGEHTQNKTLGIGWINDSDELYFTSTLKPINAPHLTKRIMLSIISQIYDPLGLLAPGVIISKVLLQRLWLCKIDWDDPVPRDVTETWNQFIKSLPSLNSFRLPRFVRSAHTKHTELHIFTDASQTAYGACAYIRTYNDDSEVTTKLLCAKSKVAPLKTLSIPRLELCGALIGAKLYKKIINSLRLSFENVFFWTDSTIVMGWLRMSPHLLKTFVQNRVTEINEMTGDSRWLHVSSSNNPADLVSRGLNFDALSRSTLWWNGPDFLLERKSNWQNDYTSLDCDLPEVRSKTINMIITTEITCVIDFERYSSYNRLTRAGAYVLRFVNNLRKCVRGDRSSRETGLLSADEVRASELALARLAQSQSFSEVHSCLRNKISLKSMKDKKSYNQLVGLNVFLDENQVIRIGGRLCNSSSFSYNKKFPILLCSKHHFTVLLFENEHRRLLHAGSLLLLSNIRENWWTIGARNLSKKVVHQCVTCTRLKGKTLNPIMGNLPPERIEANFPFIRCGVDYAGPINILNRQGRGAKLIKGYICLFICFITRAIHLELVSSLSTNDYILALKRFISRRGKPIEIFSDNGKNFVGAEKEFPLFLDANKNNINEFSTNNGIKFRFIPPYAPHFGGLWEAGVKSCKFHLRRVVGIANLTYEEFSTVLTQIEAVLNSRPISPLSSDPSDLLPLTPGHFLIGRPLTAPACDDLTSEKTSQLQRYGRIEQLRQHFWQRWSKEYISELQQRTKWKRSNEDIKLNSLVLIKEDNLPPLKWRLGRIIRISPGKDGVARVAEIRTANGVIQRAFSKICPLPTGPATD